MTLSLFSQFFSPVWMGIPLIFVSLIMPWVLFPSPTSRWFSNRLVSIQGWMLASFTKQILLPLNEEGHKWAMLFVSLMVFLFGSNLLGLLPYTFTPTTQLSLNLALAVPLWMATILVGARNRPVHVLGHLLPEGTPTLLIPVLIIIETISLFIRPLALAVRLTANLTAGHLLIHLISSGTFIMLSMMPSVAILTAALLLVLTLLEVAVAMIQAYVFVLLLSLYLQENI
uniref:ATP synthase F0 subunit 6 n=1 Tax=Physiculus nematopus TaxID=2048758 RepID=UPI0028D257D1|nr:ATP synthase F0 subunit 6 [Physiculus nematopus]WMY89621.1 ATP synthase F0 subunit 6 [Physiculus nematopus]